MTETLYMLTLYVGSANDEAPALTINGLTMGEAIDLIEEYEGYYDSYYIDTQ